MTDARLRYTATDRNRDPILDVLRDILPPRGLVLEIASGSGEHVVHFARALPGLTFQPSDPDPKARASIAAWTLSEGLANVRDPLALDAATGPWPLDAADAILCVNMIHISPWAATEGLFREVARLLPVGGPLYLYGPFVRASVETAPSNVAFDADLRRRNPAWGLRDLGDVSRLAGGLGFNAPTISEMPANNLSVVFRRRA